jgi:probable HAF family extracellular repeat protein
VPDASATRPSAINNRGQIAGEYVDRDGRSHGYLQETDGSVTTIDPPGAGATVVTDVDDQGRVVGASIDERQTAISAFVRDPDGRFTTVSHPDAGFYGTVPEGINNQGQIAGTYSDANDRTHGFVLDDGSFTTVDAPDAPGNTQVLDIDDRGRLVGASGRVSYGYLADGREQLLEIDAPGAVQTRVRGINNRGQIAIDTVDAQLVHHGFLFDSGRFTEIRPRGAAGNGSLATDVDDRGRVLGYVL